MKKPYEKPFIKRQVGGVTNKFGGVTQTRVQESIEGKRVKDLVAEYGSPLFVYSEASIIKKHRELTQAFSLRYPRFHHAWSYKTNYLKAVCRTFHRLGSWAEVVSEMEYGMARKLGVPPERIVFNGPLKPYAALKSALADGAMVNIDSLDELYDAERIATELGRIVNIGVRVNMGLDAYMAWDRFGFNIDSGAALQTVKRAVSNGKLRIIGLHCHLGTFILSPDIYRAAAEKLVEFSTRIRAEAGVRLQYIDMGGGFASRNRLKNVYLPTQETAPLFDAYAEAICGPLLAGFKPDELPELILESGRAMVDEAGSLMATVSNIRRLNNGLRAIVLDAGVNLLFTAFWYDHDIIPAVDRGSPVEDHVLYGPLCMQIDVIRPQIRLPYLERGDQVVIRPVGAYNNTQWMQFIHLRPNVVMIGENGETAIIRRGESIDYLQQPESVPEWMDG